MGNFSKWIGDQATGLFNQATGGVMGMMFGDAMADKNDKRQIEQQRKLQNMQMQGNKEMMDYGMMKQLQMWKETNYSAQMAELEKAGLNPALLYGMKGGGGVTTGSPAGGVTGGSAPTGGGEHVQGLQMGLQMRMMKAQIDLAESQANKNNVEATKTGGIDTTKAQAEVLNLQALTTNTNAKTALARIETDIADMDKEIKGKTLDDVIQIVDIEEQTARTELDRLARKNILEKATYNTAYKQIVENLTATVLENEILRKKPQMMETERNLMIAQMRGTLAKIYQDWNNLEYSGTEKASEQRLKWSEQISKETGLDMDTVDRVLQAIILKNVIKGGNATPVRGFHNR